MDEQKKDINEQKQEENNVIVEQEYANNKKNVFNIIIGIATLLIALLGATFAYFSATARSKDDDVSVKSAYVSIAYDGGTEIKASHLIPATETVAINKFTKTTTPIGKEDDETLTFIDEDEYTNDLDRWCVDALGREVCYVYRFSIDSNGEENGETAISGGVKVTENKFTNLSYILYEVTYREEDGVPLVDKFNNKVVSTFTPVSEFNNVDDNPDNIYQSIKFAKFDKPFELTRYDELQGTDVFVRNVEPIDCLFGYASEYSTFDADDIKRCSAHNIENQQKHYFELLIWLEETRERQDEQGMEFKGTVLLEVPGGQTGSEYPDGKITGRD